MRSDNLKRHKKVCGKIAGEGVRSCNASDTPTGIPFGTANQIINQANTSDVQPRKWVRDDVTPNKRTSEHTDIVNDVQSMIKKRSRDDVMNCVGAAKKRTGGDIEINEGKRRRLDRPHDGYIYPIKESKGEDKIEAELDAEAIENVLPNFIEAMIKAPKKRMEVLLKGIGKDEYADRLRSLIEEFLAGDMVVTKELEKAIKALKTTSTTVEIESILNDIEDMSTRYGEILNRLDDTDDQMAVVRALRREQQISKLAYDKMADYLETSDLSLPVVVKILKTHPHRNDDKTGSGVEFLPGTMEGLHKRFCALAAEYDAGNKATRNELVAVINALRDRNFITEKQYIGCNNWVDDQSEVQKICDRLGEMSEQYNAGHRIPAAKEMLKCMDQLIDKGEVTDEQCRDVRNQINRECGHLL